MSKVRFVGLDVHQETITVAVADADGSAPAVVGTFSSDIPRLVKQLKKLGPASSLRCCYEAGAGGFVLERALSREGIICIIVAPSLVPTKQSGERVKTDKRDALRLARFLRSGDLVAIHVPDEETEAMRDLSRARLDAVKAQLRARQQLSRFLVRHGQRYPGKRTSAVAFLKWARTVEFRFEAQRRVLADYVRATEEGVERIERLTRDISELVQQWAGGPAVTAMQALRGVQLVTAVGLVTEIGDFHRFAAAPQFMSYLGLVPGEFSSGESQRRGRITKTGNSHVRRLLVEAAWNYRRMGPSKAIRTRREAAPPTVQRIASKADDRLHRKLNKMLGRGVARPKAIVAVARELAGFVWAAGKEATAAK